MIAMLSPPFPCYMPPACRAAARLTAVTKFSQLAPVSLSIKASVILNQLTSAAHIRSIQMQ